MSGSCIREYPYYHRAFPKQWEVDEKHEIINYKDAIETTVKP